MILDPFLSQVIGHCSEDRLLQALRAIYPEIEWPENEVLRELQTWRHKGLQRPGIALSTGRRNSFKGMVTCAFLSVLGIDRPKAPRDRMTLAWAILGSAEARSLLGRVEELDVARAEWEERYGASATK